MECSSPYSRMVCVLPTVPASWAAWLCLVCNDGGLCRVSSTLDARSSSGSSVMADVGSLAYQSLYLASDQRAQHFHGCLTLAVRATIKDGDLSRASPTSGREINLFSRTIRDDGYITTYMHADVFFIDSRLAFTSQHTYILMALLIVCLP